MTKFPRHSALNNFTGFLLRRASDASFAGFCEVLAQYDLHPMHFGMLNIVDAESPISQGELSRRTGIDPSSMVARMDLLEEYGLLERTRSSEDRRSYEINLTPEGVELLGVLREKAKVYGDRFFAVLSEPEQAQLQAILEKLVAGIDEPPGQQAPEAR